jgi:hypothetical protein
MLGPTAVTLVSTGFRVVWLPPDVRGSRSVLAREWHEPDPFLTLLSDELFALCLYPAKLGGCYYQVGEEVTVMKGPSQTFWRRVAEGRRQLMTRVVERRRQVMKRNRQWIKVHMHGNGP